MKTASLLRDEGTVEYMEGIVELQRGYIRESMKITQTLVYMFYIYCNREYRTSTATFIHCIIAC